MDRSAIVTGGLMVIFAMAMVGAMLLERRRVHELTHDPDRVPADLRRRSRAGEVRRPHPEEER